MKVRVDLNLELGLQEYAPEQPDSLLPEIPLSLQQAVFPGCHDPEPAGPVANTPSRLH